MVAAGLSSGKRSPRQGRDRLNKHEFGARVELMRDRLYRIAVACLGSEDMALDAVGEAVYRAYRSKGKLRQPEFFETWITRILINECKQELRRRKREQPLDHGNAASIATSASAEPQLTADVDELANEFDLFPLRDAILHLQDDLKAVIILRFFGGLTLAKTAECLNLPQGTVATRQRRALQMLRLELSEEESE